MKKHLYDRWKTHKRRYLDIRLIMSFMTAFILTCAQSVAQETVVSGQVTTTTNEPLPGVNVVIQGTTQGTVTDIDGNYTIPVPGPNTVLVFSFIGYAAQEVPVNGQRTINVAMEEDVEQLEEVVIIGYGTQQKSDLTGSVASVEAEDIAEIGAGNPAEALQGKVSGVNVVTSGVPGQAPSIKIRGVGTLGNSNPLYVVDGVFTDDISFVNSNDIQSMEILKDASATAIYGSRGANGVILVTTKQGRSEEPSFSFNAYEGVQRVIYNDFEMVNAREYAQLINEGLDSMVYNPDEVGEGTDWFDEILRTAPMRNYQLSFNQQTDKASYYVSAGYFRQKGVLKKTDFERYTIRLNNSYKLTNMITVGHNISASWFTKDNPNNGALQWAYRISPIIPVRLPDGAYAPSPNSGAGNPVAGLEYFNNETSGQRIVGNVFGEVNFLENFTFRTSLGIDYEYNQNTTFAPVYEVSASQKNEESRIGKNWDRWFDWLWENTLTYDRVFGIHHVNVLAGITSQRTTYERLGGSRTNVPSNDENLWYLNAGSTEGVTNTNPAWASAIASYLFRANYTLMDRYLFTATFRADGSSKFPSGDRWGYFPSVALGWRISEESFMENLGWLSNLKIRGSWGQIGNQNIRDYQYYPKAAIGIKYNAIFGNDQLQRGSTITELSNADITWETATQTDVGIELGLLQNSLQIEVDYYHRETDDILIPIQIPATVGLASTDANIGSVLNKGVDFTVDYTRTVGEFTVDVGLSGTTIHNEVLDLRGVEFLQGGNIGGGNNVTRASVGDPIGYFFGYKTIGVFQDQQQIDNAPDHGEVAPGDLIFEDNNGSDAEGNPTGQPDGVIDANDRTIIGSPIPDFTGGLNLGLAYRGFDLSISLTGMFGNEIFNAKQHERYSGLDNFDQTFLDRWTGPGTNDTEPRTTFAGHNYLVSSRFVEDGSFVKLRNVQLGYNLPEHIVERLQATSIRIYISGNNLLYFTDYSGFSPEIESSFLYENENDPRAGSLGAGIDRALYPVTAVYKAGLNITF